MLSVKKHSYALLPRWNSGRRETIKKKKPERRKRKTVFSPKDILTKDMSKTNSKYSIN